MTTDQGVNTTGSLVITVIMVRVSTMVPTLVKAWCVGRAVKRLTSLRWMSRKLKTQSEALSSFISLSVARPSLADHQLIVGKKGTFHFTSPVHSSNPAEKFTPRGCLNPGSYYTNRSTSMTVYCEMRKQTNYNRLLLIIVYRTVSQRKVKMKC